MSENPSIDQIEWSQSHSLKSQLPYEFDNGLEFNGFNAQCSGCLKYIEEGNLRGNLVPLKENECLLFAKGYCAPCNGITRYSFRLIAEENLRVEAFTAADGEG